MLQTSDPFSVRILAAPLLGFLFCFRPYRIPRRKIFSIFPSVEAMFQYIQKGFEEKIGFCVIVTVIEYDSIDTS